MLRPADSLSLHLITAASPEKAWQVNKKLTDHSRVKGGWRGQAGDQATCHGLAFPCGLGAHVRASPFRTHLAEKVAVGVPPECVPLLLASSLLPAWALAFALNIHLFFLLQF